jgi:lysozyme
MGQYQANGLNLKISPEGLEFICGFEGFMPHAYRDTGGLPTIGYGTRLTDMQQYPNGITEKQARDFIAGDIAEICKKISKCPIAGLQQYQYDAIISLIYNLGLNEFFSSTIYKKITSRSWDLQSWTWYIKDVKDHTDTGLLLRRQAELRLFIYGIYKD